MIREHVYKQIFEKMEQALKKKYSLDSTTSSEEFEAGAVEVLKEVITNWNDAQPEDEKLDIDVRRLGKHHFPDIVIENQTDHEKIGLEVKYHVRDNSWKTTGNSAYESISEDGLSKIYLLFGHFKKIPPEFRIRPMERCLSDVTITHSPRYNIDMEYGQDFCDQELGMPYECLRHIEQEQREVYVNTYISKKKYKELTSVNNKEQLIAQSFILFPEIFSQNAQARYRRMSVWLFSKNILCRNVRDFLSASGKQKVDVIGPKDLPRVFSRLYEHRTRIRSEIAAFPQSVLEKSWYEETIWQGEITIIPDDVEERLNLWINILSEQYGGPQKEIDDSPYYFKETLEKLLKP